MKIARALTRLAVRLTLNVVTDPYVGIAAVVALVVAMELDWYPWAGWL